MKRGGTQILLELVAPNSVDVSPRDMGQSGRKTVRKLSGDEEKRKIYIIYDKSSPISWRETRFGLSSVTVKKRVVPS